MHWRLHSTPSGFSRSVAQHKIWHIHPLSDMYLLTARGRQRQRTVAFLSAQQSAGVVSTTTRATGYRYDGTRRLLTQKQLTEPTVHLVYDPAPPKKPPPRTETKNGRRGGVRGRGYRGPLHRGRDRQGRDDQTPSPSRERLGPLHVVVVGRGVQRGGRARGGVRLGRAGKWCDQDGGLESVQRFLSVVVRVEPAECRRSLTLASHGTSKVAQICLTCLRLLDVIPHASCLVRRRVVRILTCLALAE